MIRKTIQKLVYGIRTKWHEGGGKRQEVLAVDHRVDLLRGGEGPPLVYLHGVLGETRWYPFHQALAARFDVIAPAHPGYGETEGLGAIEAADDVVFHYLDLFEGLGITRAHVVGVSLGGWIAAELAVRHPDLVGKLVLADAYGLALDDAAAERRASPFARATDVEALRGALFANPEGAMAEIVLPNREDVPPRVVQSYAPLVEDPKLARRLRRIASPTLVLWGERDRVRSLAHAEAYRDAIPNAELVVLPDCGHLPQFEQGARFAAAVSDFLSRDERRALKPAAPA
jgi:pimeloyl-ACP methyl ester carboxylesterase